MKSGIQSIPENLIYELIDGKPIYYKGYRDFLTGDKKIEELMGSSYLQSLIITKMVYDLMSNLDKKWLILTNEIGLNLGSNSFRAADIAILDSQQLEGVEKGNKYLNIPPKVIIEIDTKAELEEVEESYSYFHKKTDDLLSFGVEKVIWIFTDSEKIMISEKDENWQITPWSKDIPILNELSVNLKELLAD